MEEILGLKQDTDLLEITGKGTEALNAKRSEAIELYERMAKRHSEDRADFYKGTPSYEWALPMMAVLGFTGPAMTYMLSRRAFATAPLTTPMSPETAKSRMETSLTGSEAWTRRPLRDTKASA